MTGTRQKVVSLARDWRRFQRYKRDQRMAEAAAEATTPRLGMSTHVRQTIYGIVIGSVILIAMLVWFAFSVDSDPADPDKPPLVGEEPATGAPSVLLPMGPPNMDLESAYKGGYFTDPENGVRYLVVQIDRRAKVPSGWICRRAAGLPTRQCLARLDSTDLGSAASSESADDAPVAPQGEPEPADEPETVDEPEAAAEPEAVDKSESLSTAGPEAQGQTESSSGDTVKSDKEAKDSGGGFLNGFAALGTGFAGLAALIVAAVTVPKHVKEFRAWRASSQTTAPADAVPADPVTHDAAEHDHARFRRPSIDGDDLSPPV